MPRISDDAVMPGDDRHPTEPHLVALGHAVVHHHRLGFRPGVGEVVYGIEKFYAVVQPQFHLLSPVFSPGDY